MVHERVAFGEKTSKAEIRAEARSRRSEMLSDYKQDLFDASKIQPARNAVRPSVPDHRQESRVVHERVAIGETVSKAERRSAFTSHRSNMLSDPARERITSEVQETRSAVRPRQDPNPDPGSTEG